MTSWKFWAKSLIMVSQIHSSVSLPPPWMCQSNCAEIFLIQRCILGPLRYPKKSIVQDIGLFMTLVCLLILWYTLQLVINSSTLSQSPVKTLGSFPIILSDNAPWSAVFPPPAGSGLPPLPPPPLGLGSSSPPPPLLWCEGKSVWRIPSVLVVFPLWDTPVPRVWATMLSVRVVVDAICAIVPASDRGWRGGLLMWDGMS